jgi:hypothetical protein
MDEFEHGQWISRADYLTEQRRAEEAEKHEAEIIDRLYCNCSEPYFGAQIIGSPVRCERCRKEVGDVGPSLVWGSGPIGNSEDVELYAALTDSAPRIEEQADAK